MTANQVQIRRDSAANIDANTPTNGELAYDTTNKRLRVGDGVNQGGTILPNAFDNQGQKFISGTVGGTADAITLAIAPAPAAYAIYQRFVVKANSTNTGPATFKINTLAAVSIKKKTDAGIADVEAGDIQQDGMYQFTYDGTYFQIESSAGGGGAQLWELISTATASASATVDLELPSGYKEFKLIIENLRPSSNSVAPMLLYSVNGGSSYLNPTGKTNADSTGINFVGIPGGGSSHMRFLTYSSTTSTGDLLGNASGRFFNSAINIYKNAVSAYSTYNTNISATFKTATVFTGLQNSDIINYIRIQMNSGNIAEGNFFLYGIKEPE